jgi:amidase
VPAGYVAGLPVGVTFFGANLSELQLLSLAYAWEQAMGVRVPPAFPDSVDLPALPAPEEAAAASPEAGASVTPAE